MKSNGLFILALFTFAAANAETISFTGNLRTDANVIACGSRPHVDVFDN